MSDDDKISKGVCPACDNNLVFQEGCKRCHLCGWAGCDG